MILQRIMLAEAMSPADRLPDETDDDVPAVKKKAFGSHPSPSLYPCLWSA
jgi:hypothetical protein